MKQFYLIILSTCYVAISFGVNQIIIDSLSLLLQNNLSDTARWETSRALIRAYYFKGDEAFALAFTCDSIAKKNSWQTPIAQSSDYLGILYDFCQNNTEATKWTLRTIDLAKALGDSSLMARNFYRLGGIFSSVNREEAIRYHKKALLINQALKHFDSEYTSLSQIGFMYQMNQDYDEARIWYLKMLDMGLKNENTYYKEYAWSQLGLICEYLEDFDCMISYYTKTLQSELKKKDSIRIAYSKRTLGEIWAQKGEIKKAEKLLAEANFVIRIKGTLHEKAWFLMSTGKFYIGIESFSLGKKYLNESLEFALQDNGLNRNVTLKTIFEVFIDAADKENDYKTGYYYYKRYVEIQDTIREIENAFQVTGLLKKYEAEKKQMEIEALEKDKLKQKALTNAEKKTQNIITFSIGSGLIMALIVALILFRRFKKERHQKAIIKEQKQLVENQRDKLDHKNKEILDSITYAERIQSAILPPLNLVKQLLPNSFILYKPKDIVAGDFYWLEQIEDDIYFSAADCTGHGVPGAMMSVMCSNAVTKCVKELGLTKPREILDATTKIIEGRFERSEQIVLDGMDLALCKLNLKTMRLEYAGANNPLWIIRVTNNTPPPIGAAVDSGGAESGGVDTPREQTTTGTSALAQCGISDQAGDDKINFVLEETKADKQPIGQYDHRQPYTNHKIELQKGDSIYIFSDGYVDQFGGPKGKKFKSKPLKALLLTIQNESMEKQMSLIDKAFEDWRGGNEQIDDVVVMGVRV